MGVVMEPTLSDVESIMETAVRPVLKQHFGDIECVSLEGGRLNVRLLGACRGCPSAKETLEETVLSALNQVFPTIEEVVLHQEVSREVMDFAKSLMTRSKSNVSEK